MNNKLIKRKKVAEIDYMIELIQQGVDKMKLVLQLKIEYDKELSDLKSIEKKMLQFTDEEKKKEVKGIVAQNLVEGIFGIHKKKGQK